jgi:L-fuconolactonase
VAYASLTTPATLDRTLDALSARPSVRGIRHNIQGEAPGFCTQASFVDGVRKVGARGLTFDLCATHDQLSDVIRLVHACPNTRFVLDHCGKPAVRDRLLDPWRGDIARLAECENVWCKISGLVTEASLASWREEDLVPYASHVVERFGADRVLYGSDWPVLTLAAQYADWFRFTEQFTASWSADERRAFYGGNALKVYATQSN